MPKLASVRPAGGLAIKVAWSRGPRARRTETVDLSPLIRSFGLYKRLRTDRALFRTVHLIEAGEAIAWGDDDGIDMAATSIERLAEEALTSEELRAFLEREGLTQEAAAAMLGYSRRQIAHYLAGDRPIPRVFALACRGLAARRAARGGGVSSDTIPSPHSSVGRGLG
jgi:Helix-turn-helix domain